MSSVAIITAHGGSKRIPRKNVKEFMGKPMVAYSWRIRRDSEGLQSGLQSGHELGQSRRPELGQLSGLQMSAGDKILALLETGALSVGDLVVQLQVSRTTKSFRNALRALLDDGLIEYTVPGNPKSRLQKYRLTGKAQDLMIRFKRGVSDA